LHFEQIPLFHFFLSDVITHKTPSIAMIMMLMGRIKIKNEATLVGKCTVKFFD